MQGSRAERFTEATILVNLFLNVLLAVKEAQILLCVKVSVDLRCPFQGVGLLLWNVKRRHLSQGAHRRHHWSQKVPVGGQVLGPLEGEQK